MAEPDALDALVRAAGVAPDHPTLRREGAFLRHWAATLLRPDDPQRPRWLALELDQVHRNRAIARELSRELSLEGARVLDVGCQLGALPIALTELGAVVTGVDVDDALLDGARRRCECYGASVTLMRAEAEGLPFPDGAFDAVTFVDVIEHVRDARRSVAEIARVLKPGGVLYLFGPNRFAPGNLRRDPHYQLAGVSALPHAVGHWYVTRVRGFPSYDVGVLPVGGVVRRWLEAEGLHVTRSPVDDADAWWRSRTPAALHALAPAARLWGHARTSAASLFRLVAVKR